MSINRQSKIGEWQGKVASQHTDDRKNYLAAPSAGPNVMRIYEELIIRAAQGKSNFKALVLGSTPELRDFVLKHKGQLHSIDISLDMMHKTSKLLKEQTDQFEHMLRSDWLENPLADNYFDVVIGDGVANNIALDKQDQFFSNIYRVLKPGGHLVLREGVINPNRKPATLEEIDKNFQDEKIHWFDLLINMYWYSDISPKCTDQSCSQKSFIKFYDELENEFLKGRVSKKAIDAVWWFRKNLNHTIMNKFDLIDLMNKYFQLHPVDQSQDYEFTKDTFLFFFGQAKK